MRKGRHNVTEGINRENDLDITQLRALILRCLHLHCLPHSQTEISLTLLNGWKCKFSDNNKKKGLAVIWAETQAMLKQLVLKAGSVEIICCFKSLHWETNMSTHLNDFLAAKCLGSKKKKKKVDK